MGTSLTTLRISPGSIQALTRVHFFFFVFLFFLESSRSMVPFMDRREGADDGLICGDAAAVLINYEGGEVAIKALTCQVCSQYRV
jgi:hypothetical protein